MSELPPSPCAAMITGNLPSAIGAFQVAPRTRSANGAVTLADAPPSARTTCPRIHERAPWLDRRKVSLPVEKRPLKSCISAPASACAGYQIRVATI